jgi:phosphoglycerate dehydrogenase-like enzyme
MINGKTLKIMKKSAFLVNAPAATRRGRGYGDALNAGTIAGAALDVVDSRNAAKKILSSRQNCTRHPAHSLGGPRGEEAAHAHRRRKVKAYLSGKPVNVVIADESGPRGSREGSA